MDHLTYLSALLEKLDFWSDEAGKKCLEDIRLHEPWKQENYDFLNKSRSSSFREHSGELWLFFAGGVEWLRFSCPQREFFWGWQEQGGRRGSFVPDWPFTALGGPEGWLLFHWHSARFPCWSRSVPVVN